MKHSTRAVLFGSIGLVLGSGLPTSVVHAQEVTIREPWVRGTVRGQKATGAFMQLTASESATLVAVESPVAGSVQIHEMKMENDVMQMRPISRLDLPAGKAVELKPGGGYHVMLMDLKQPLKKGEAVPIKLRFEAKDKTFKTIEIQAQVRELGASQKH
ncbi:MAG: copper chaperone PCu(A)C [Burkholderiales bacterium]